MINPAPNQLLSRVEDWNSSAGDYNAYASHMGLYRESAEFLVQLAELEFGMTVLDLGCGTGVTTEAILRQMQGGEGKVIGVDFSPEMLAFARKRIDSNKVEFHCREAEKLGEVVRSKVDRVISNAAFWHFDVDKVFSELSLILKPSGRCLISVPADSWKDVNYFSQLYEKHRCIWMLMEEKELRGYLPRKLSTPAAKPKMNSQQNEIWQSLTSHGLRVSRIETMDLFLPPQDYLAFLRIPIMAKNSFLFRGVPEQEVQEILDVASKQLDWLELPDAPVNWKVYVIEPAIESVSPSASP